MHSIWALKKVHIVFYNYNLPSPCKTDSPRPLKTIHPNNPHFKGDKNSPSKNDMKLQLTNFKPSYYPNVGNIPKHYHYGQQGNHGRNSIAVA